MSYQWAWHARLSWLPICLPQVKDLWTILTVQGYILYQTIRHLGFTELGTITNILNERGLAYNVMISRCLQKWHVIVIITIYRHGMHSTKPGCLRSNRIHYENHVHPKDVKTLLVDWYPLPWQYWIQTICLPLYTQYSIPYLMQEL